MKNLRTSLRAFLLVGFLAAGHPAASLLAQSANSAGGNGTERGTAVSYTVSADTERESFRVGAILSNITQDTITFNFPIWGPGAYDIVNFGGYVSNFKATSSTGRDLLVQRLDTSTFRIIGSDRQISISYDVKDIESVENSLWFGLSDIEKDFAFANTPAIFGYPAGYKDVPYMVTYEVPKGWDIAIGLDPVDGKEAKGEGRHTFKARDYDELVDAPLSMGTFQRLEFTAKGKPHVIAVFGPKKLEQPVADELVEVTKQVVTLISDLFGDMPYDRYIFQHYLVTPQPGDAIFGALEHRNSSTYRMPAPGGFSGGSAAEILKSVIAHEYWHLWSPKRIHVAELGPFDYQRAPRTNSLWFAEGLTEYYAQVLLARNGMGSPRALVSSLNQAVASSYGKGQSRSIADLSMHISEVPPMDIFPLYTKGPILGFLLDASIRAQTGNSKSLDDVMRYFNDQYGKTGRTFTDEEIIPIMEKATGARLADFFQRYIVGTEPLPFEEYLPKMGLKVEVERKQKPTFGATLEKVDQGWKITGINPGESAEKMGLKAGDVVLTIRYKRSTVETTTVPPSYADAIATMRDVVGFDVIQNGKTKSVDAVIVAGTSITAKAVVDPAASAQALAIRKGIFGF